MFIDYQKLSEAISDVIAAYSSDQKCKRYFSDSIKRLEDLEKMLDSKSIRIAIIGITSSGKSTLMNTILGDPLLPTRVAPSSSKQVICGYSEKQYAIIKFTDESGKKDKIVTHDILKELSKYGDEKFNPHNEKQVEELQVFSPKFRFRKELIFIDTPGLDAYGLTEHEEITLKLVLPSVEMVLFLTNVKCDSDRQNLEFIDRATSDDKPLIVVQNKIDSIEEKRSKTYGVEKTKKQVKEEHKKRIETLLKGAKRTSVKKAPVVQISAKCADWEESNIGGLQKVLSEQVDKNLERFRCLRIRQFQKQLQEDYSSLQVLLKSQTEQEKKFSEQKNNLENYRQNLENAERLQKEIDDEVKNRLETIQSTAEWLVYKLNGKNSRQNSNGFRNSTDTGILSVLKNFMGDGVSKRQLDSLPEDVRQKFDLFKRCVADITPWFSKSISSMQDALKVCCKVMTLDFKQIVRITPVGSFLMESENVTDTVQGKYHPAVYRKVKRQTLGGGIKRFFGSIFGQDDWGYDEVLEREAYYEDKTVYSIEKMLAYIHKNYTRLVQFFDEKYGKFEVDTTYSIDQLKDRYESLNEQLDTQIRERESLPRDLVKKLVQRLEKWLLMTNGTESIDDIPIANISVEESQAITGNNEPSIEKLQMESCQPWEVALLHLAQSQCLEINRKYMSKLIAKSHIHSKVFICGWDENYIEKFRNFFFRSEDDVECMDFTSMSSLQPQSCQGKLVFLIVNAEQSGSMEKKLYDAQVLQLLHNVLKTGQLIWVMDSVKGLANWKEPKNDTLAEAYLMMVQMAERFTQSLNQKPYEFMACDSELYYSVLFHELYYNNWDTEAKRQQFIKEISDVFHLNDDRKHITGRYLNDFSNYRRA